eukprot:TRINITY_DN7993_c0_g1_i1.p1 TRINITY_DN7993_c0_g1~~TRINITY_DN7993_c0_g1_i1.p1  ORF type:complete len:139 (-),score=22.18 TRINITY_DN7993_c0_g1_i1:247-663(-)
MELRVFLSLVRILKANLYQMSRFIRAVMLNPPKKDYALSQETKQGIREFLQKMNVFQKDEGNIQTSVRREYYDMVFSSLHVIYNDDERADVLLSMLESAVAQHCSCQSLRLWNKLVSHTSAVHLMLEAPHQKRVERVL